MSMTAFSLPALAYAWSGVPRRQDGDVTFLRGSSRADVTFLSAGSKRRRENGGRRFRALLTLPSGRGQRCEVVLVGHRGQAPEHITKVLEGVLAVALTGDDEGVDDRGALSRLGMADEEPVFPPEDGRPDRILNEIVVETGDRVLLVRHQYVPVIEQIRAGFP